jgi:hypothetical protein
VLASHTHASVHVHALAVTASEPEQETITEERITASPRTNSPRKSNANTPTRGSTPARQARAHAHDTKRTTAQEVERGVSPRKTDTPSRKPAKLPPVEADTTTLSGATDAATGVTSRVSTPRRQRSDQQSMQSTETPKATPKKGANAAVSTPVRGLPDTQSTQSEHMHRGTPKKGAASVVSVPDIDHRDDIQATPSIQTPKRTPKTAKKTTMSSQTAGEEVHGIESGQCEDAARNVDMNTALMTESSPGKVRPAGHVQYVPRNEESIEMFDTKIAVNTPHTVLGNEALSVEHTQFGNVEKHRVNTPQPSKQTPKKGLFARGASSSTPERKYTRSHTDGQYAGTQASRSQYAGMQPNIRISPYGKARENARQDADTLDVNEVYASRKTQLGHEGAAMSLHQEDSQVDDDGKGHKRWRLDRYEREKLAEPPAQAPDDLTLDDFLEHSAEKDAGHDDDDDGGDDDYGGVHNDGDGGGELDRTCHEEGEYVYVCVVCVCVKERERRGCVYMYTHACGHLHNF